MKLFKILFIALLAINTISCKPGKKEAKTEQTAVEGELKTALINIEGMTCAIGCAKTIEAKLSQQEGIKSAKVDFENKIGTFTYDDKKACEITISKKINSLLDGKTYKATPVGKKECTTKSESETQEI